MRTEFKVKPHYPSGFDISIGIGKVFWAKNLNEVKIGLEHYFREGKFNSHSLKPKRNCPLC